MVARCEVFDMNPITRMMKRYIKTPLKYALPLLFIGSLVLVSISGCTSPTSNATATPTATPTTASKSTQTSAPTTGFNPLLATLESKLKSEYAATK